MKNKILELINFNAVKYFFIFSGILFFWSFVIIIVANLLIPISE